MSQDVMSYEETLAYSQGIRKQLVDTYTSNGMENLVKDEGSVDKLLKTLKDMDGTAIAHRKNQIDQSGADSSRDVAEAMRQFVEMQMNKNPFQRRADGSIAEEAGTGVIPKVDESKLGHHELVEGETEQGVIMETSADFMARMEAVRAAREASGEDND